MRVFVTSDSHFRHANIIKYCNRPFNSVGEMDWKLIKMWNDQVSEDDLVIFLGDFLFAKKNEAQEITEFYNLVLHGKKIIVKGNHDYRHFRYKDVGFVAEYYQSVQAGGLYFMHVPNDLDKLSKQYREVFYGHIHNNPQWIPAAAKNCTNVCLDANDFKLIDITDLITEEEVKILMGENENE